MSGFVLVKAILVADTPVIRYRSLYDLPDQPELLLVSTAFTDAFDSLKETDNTIYGLITQEQLQNIETTYSITCRGLEWGLTADQKEI